MSRVRVVALIVAVIVVAFGVVLAVNVESGDPTTGGIIGQTPEYELETIDGRVLASDELVGKTVVINFWNTWCAPCIAELPALKEFHEAHKNDPDFVMIGIVRDDTEGAVAAGVIEEGIGWDITMDPDSRAALAFGVTGQPETFVIAPDGRVVGEKRFEVSLDDLEVMLAAAQGPS